MGTIHSHPPNAGTAIQIPNTYFFRANTQILQYKFFNATTYTRILTYKYLHTNTHIQILTCKYLHTNTFNKIVCLSVVPLLFCISIYQRMNEISLQAFNYQLSHSYPKFLTTEALRSLDGTIASAMSSKWHKSSDAFMWWSVGSDGPCTPTTGICKVKPKDRGGESRFNIHQIRWAYGVVKQNAARVKQMATGVSTIYVFVSILLRRTD